MEGLADYGSVFRRLGPLAGCIDGSVAKKYLQVG
jgi:hypothetical protein